MGKAKDGTRLRISLGKQPIGMVIRPRDDPSIGERLVKKKQTLSSTFMHLAVLVISGPDAMKNSDKLIDFINLYHRMRVKCTSCFLTIIILLE